MACLTDNGVIENDAKLIQEFYNRGFGCIKGEVLLLAPVEALYLTEIKKITIEKDDESAKISKKKGAGFKKMYDIVSLFNELKRQDKELATKYYVYRDLRKKGYVVRTGLKYGAFFRVYEKGVRPGEGHSHWLVHPIPEQQKISLYELSRAVHLSHSVRKKMLWAVVNSEGSITYYKIERMQP
ncbi:MAG: tRNA-intron lyase [Candidatus Micrarchaeia archaeon]